MVSAVIADAKDIAVNIPETGFAEWDKDQTHIV
jgi:hypothetical protein